MEFTKTKINESMTPVSIVEFNKIKMEAKKYKIISVILHYIILTSAFFLLWFFFWKTNAWYITYADTLDNNIYKKTYSVQNKIRQERIEACATAYKDSWLTDMYIYNQLPVVRCATYMTIVYVFESNFWKSKMCKENKNCYWITGNGIDTPSWFLKFKSYKKWNEYFAKKYFQFHYKKSYSTFVNHWSTTDRDEYKAFFKQKYTKIYSEIEKIFVYN